MNQLKLATQKFSIEYLSKEFDYSVIYSQMFDSWLKKRKNVCVTSWFEGQIHQLPMLKNKQNRYNLYCGFSPYIDQNSEILSYASKTKNINLKSLYKQRKLCNLDKIDDFIRVTSVDELCDKRVLVFFTSSKKYNIRLLQVLRGLKNKNCIFYKTAPKN